MRSIGVSIFECKCGFLFTGPRSVNKAYKDSRHIKELIYRKDTEIIDQKTDELRPMKKKELAEFLESVYNSAILWKKEFVKKHKKNKFILKKTFENKKLIKYEIQVFLVEGILNSDKKNLEKAKNIKIKCPNCKKIAYTAKF